MYLMLAKKFLAEGDEHRARGIILAHRRDPCSDPEVHFQWGLLCEEISAFNQARQSYEQALKLSPRNGKYLYRLARLHFDVGHYEKALDLGTQAVRYGADSEEARRLLAELYESAGHEGSARIVKRTEKESCPLRYFPPTVCEADIDTFLRLFSGREMGYATQKLRADTGQARWVYSGNPVTPDLVEKHILGEITLGGLPLRSDNTVKYAAIHIRPCHRVVLRHLRNPSILTQLGENAEQQAGKLVAVCTAHGIPAYLEDSAAGGRRVWFFFARFFHFLLVKRFLDRVVAAVPLLDSRLVVDPLLATQPVGIGWREQPVMLPMGVDRRTERRSLFKNPDGEAFPEQLKFIRKIRELDEPALRNAFRNAGISLDRISGRSPGETYLKDVAKKCSVLAELNNKAQSGRKLSSDEKLILFYTLGLSAKAKWLIHDVLQPCPDYDYQKVERILGQIKPHPISCLKIRALIPEITASVNCSCAFDLRGGKYPSPFLHLEPETSLCVTAPDSERASLNELARRYFLTLARREEIETELRRLQSVVEARLAGKGVSAVATAHGTLRLVTEGERPQLIMER